MAHHGSHGRHQCRILWRGRQGRGGTVNWCSVLLESECCTLWRAQEGGGDTGLFVVIYDSKMQSCTQSIPQQALRRAFRRG